MLVKPYFKYSLFFQLIKNVSKFSNTLYLGYPFSDDMKSEKINSLIGPGQRFPTRISRRQDNGET